jgi:hypothetical protein
VAGVALTVGLGLTVIVAVAVVELKHPAPDEAVIVNVVVCATLVVLVRVPEIGEPVPVAAIPVRLILLSLVQLKVVPDTLLGLVTTMFVMTDPEQIV